jgi:hypothetical protein
MSGPDDYELYRRMVASQQQAYVNQLNQLNAANNMNAFAHHAQSQSETARRAEERRRELLLCLD